MIDISLCRSWGRRVHLISGLSSLPASLRACLRSRELRGRRHYMENIWKLSMPLSICWWTEIELQVWAHYSDKRCAGITIRQRRRRSEVRNARNATCESLTILEDENKERLLSVCLSLTWWILGIFLVYFFGGLNFSVQKNKDTPACCFFWSWTKSDGKMKSVKKTWRPHFTPISKRFR